ncbi:MAG: sigma-54-dependent Fis family transcriptional regulator [Myxococcaceae bacterium]|nr:sigma-54-dependent Fis family transcriptional regulator [Myxococcaceae bacterium]
MSVEGGARAGVQKERRAAKRELIGESPGMRLVRDLIARAALSDATVFVFGESGTGKELVARALHERSPRCRKPFVAVNCAALNESLLDSELFGHVRGAFTGAIRSRRGLFEEADGGTLFIDEITETSSGFQAKLLRALQEREIRRLGDNSAIHIDVRVIAATNRDPTLAIREGRLREDLFYRLNVVPLAVPPLRDRPEDIPLLARHFLQRAASAQGRRLTLSDEALEHLRARTYPGNVRELENAIERAVALATSEVLGPENFPLDATAKPLDAIAADHDTPAEDLILDIQLHHGLAEILEQVERALITNALAHFSGDLELVAEALKISPTTLWRKMRRHGLKPPKPGDS